MGVIGNIHTSNILFGESKHVIKISNIIYQFYTPITQSITPKTKTSRSLRSLSTPLSPCLSLPSLNSFYLLPFPYSSASARTSMYTCCFSRFYCDSLNIFTPSPMIGPLHFPPSASNFAFSIYFEELSVV